MSDDRPCLREDLLPLNRMRTPAWVVDLERGDRWWCNNAGLALWNAVSIDEWISRNISSAASEATRTRFANLSHRLNQGEQITARWSFYPDGAEPVVAECMVSRLVIADAPATPGRLGMLVEARPLTAGDVDPSERRGYEAMRYLSELVSYYSATGEVLMRNPAAQRAFGNDTGGDRLLASFAEPATAAALRECLAGQAVYRADVLAQTVTGARWFDTDARTSLDPVTGTSGVLVTQRDISEQRAHLEELERRGQLLATQAEALRHLAAPVMRVGPGVLALPLIGSLDRSRLDAALAAILARTRQGSVTRVVLDLTGTDTFDQAATAGLLRLVQVLRLQGIAPALSGIPPNLAVELARADQDLGSIPCFQNLAAALKNR